MFLCWLWSQSLLRSSFLMSLKFLCWHFWCLHSHLLHLSRVSQVYNFPRLPLPWKTYRISKEEVANEFGHPLPGNKWALQMRACDSEAGLKDLVPKLDIL
jgi:hypothetical protein